MKLTEELKSNLARILFEKKEAGKEVKQKEIASALGVTTAQVSAWINGKTYPRAVKLYQLAKLLDVKVDDLYELKED